MDMYLLKFPYRKILLPLAKKLSFIDPDLVSYAATLVAFATMFCYLLAYKNPILLIVSIAFTLLRMTLNTIDGVMAIERGNLRLKGEIVNALPDRYSDIFILLGIGLSSLCTPLLGMLGLASVFLVSYTGMLGKAIGGNWQHHGPLGKVERLILIMIFSFLQYLNLTGKVSNLFNFTYFEWLMIIFVVLGQVTVLKRLTGQLRECAKSDWIKYRKIDKNIIVVYDSITGNTQKVAVQIADSLCAKIINAQEAINLDFSVYDLIVFASPNLGRKKTTSAIQTLLSKNLTVKNYALAITSGMPIYRLISTQRCIKYFVYKLGKKPLVTINIKGYHQIAKTYANHPNENDLLDAYLFGTKIIGELKNV